MHAVVDIETLSIRARPAILAIGAVPFEFGQPLQESNRFYRGVDLGDAMRHGSIDAETLRWWMGQGDEVRRATVAPGDRLEDVLEFFASWLDRVGIKHVWAGGPSFDLAHLAEAYRTVGHEPPWDYRSERCSRTALALWDPAEQCRVAPEVAHHPLKDAEATARSLLAAFEQASSGSVGAMDSARFRHACEPGAL